MSYVDVVLARFSILLAVVGCSEHATPASNVPARTESTAPVATAQTVGPDPVADAWMTAPDDQYVKAADCPSFKKVPATILKSTFVEGPCIEITALNIAQNANLVIVATRKLQIDDGAKIIGKGTRGTPGTPAPTTTKDWTPEGPAQSEKIRCACSASHCKPGWEACSAGNDNDLRGGHGGNGQRGASIVIVARELAVGTGVSVDVSGGLGGEAGTSGKVDCHYGAMSCFSAPATSYGDGEGGATGTLALKVSLRDVALTMMIAVEHVTMPPSAISKQVVDTAGAFRHAVEEARSRGGAYERSP